MMIESVQRDEVLSCPAKIQVFLASKPFAPRSFAGKKQVLKLIEGLKILLSAHAWTSKANILRLDQKAVKCTTCKRLCGKF